MTEAPPALRPARYAESAASVQPADHAQPIQPVRSAQPVHFLIPGDLAALTGGYAYDRAIIAGLRGLGRTVEVHGLDASFPAPHAAALEHAARVVEELPDGSAVVVDGLAFGALPALARAHAARLNWVALVHHPLALETGLDATRREVLVRSEREALATADRVIVTSAATARALQTDYDVPGARLQVVRPGVPALPTPASTAAGRGEAHVGDCARVGAQDGTLNLLCVATVTPRKGHGLLIEALSGLKDRAWRLDCVGSLTRDPATVQSLHRLIAEHQLSDRVHLLGEVPDADLALHYARADLFVLPTHHEGYGMAAAEAMAHGLPVLSSAVGALPETVPADAGLLLPPGDVVAWREALARLLDEPALRARLALGARAAGACLPTWSESAALFEQALS